MVCVKAQVSFLLSHVRILIHYRLKQHLLKTGGIRERKVCQSAEFLTPLLPHTHDR